MKTKILGFEASLIVGNLLPRNTTIVAIIFYLNKILLSTANLINI